jgi:hypothetical protein
MLFDQQPPFSNQRGKGSDDGAETPKAFGKLAGLLVKSKL